MASPCSGWVGRDRAMMKPFSFLLIIFPAWDSNILFFVKLNFKCQIFQVLLRMRAVTLVWCYIAKRGYHQAGRTRIPKALLCLLVPNTFMTPAKEIWVLLFDGAHTSAHNPARKLPFFCLVPDRNIFLTSLHIGFTWKTFYGTGCWVPLWACQIWWVFVVSENLHLKQVLKCR